MILLRHLAFAAAVSVAILAQPARADLVIEGRAAQALHCAAMLFMVSSMLNDAGMIDDRTAHNAKRGAVRMLGYVPGTLDQKTKAMGQRFEKLMQTRTIEQLFKEYQSTSRWCETHFD